MKEYKLYINKWDQEPSQWYGQKGKCRLLELESQQQSYPTKGPSSYNNDLLSMYAHLCNSGMTVIMNSFLIRFKSCITSTTEIQAKNL